MPFYSDELIEEVRSRNDIVDVISQYVRLSKKGSTYFGLCPFHSEKTGSFSVSPGKQMYYCFGCGAGGNVFTFLQNYENLTFPEAVKHLADRAGVTLPEREVSEEEKKAATKRELLFRINKEAATYFYTLLRNQHGRHALEYFRGRALSDETMQKFGLGYSDKYSDDLYRALKQKGYEDSLLKDTGLITFNEKKGAHDKFWNRAMFPIMDARGKVIGFGGRVMGEGEPKYLNSPETEIFNKSRNLYALHLARMSRRPYMLLCEGYMDVIALHQAGFDNAVASLGTAFTEGHANLLKRYTKEVYLTFDSDDAGIRAALRAIPILQGAGLPCRVITLTPYKDPDEFLKNLGNEEFEERIKSAENSFLFSVRILKESYDMQDPASKTAFQQEVARRLLSFTDAAERENYLEAVAERHGIGPENLRGLVNKLGTEEGLALRRPEKKSGVNERKTKEPGIRKSERLLLTWMVEDEQLFDSVGKYIRPPDFSDELYRKAAEILYEQHDKGSLNPAGILDLFPEEEDQRELASVFHARLEEVRSDEEKEKALKDTVIKIKRESINRRSLDADPSDIRGLQQTIRDKQELEKLEKIRFTF